MGDETRVSRYDVCNCHPISAVLNYYPKIVCKADKEPTATRKGAQKKRPG
jgi:hypothetical protein